MFGSACKHMMNVMAIYFLIQEPMTNTPGHGQKVGGSFIMCRLEHSSIVWSMILWGTPSAIIWLVDQFNEGRVPTLTSRDPSGIPLQNQ